MIDTHSHLFVEEFSEDLPSVIKRAKDVGVERVFMPNIDDESLEDMLQVCSLYPGYCYPMLGYHPTSVDTSSMAKVLRMKEHLVSGHPFIAIGEVGLDLYWDKTYLNEQLIAFEQQIEWALQYNLPIVIHVRDAFEYIKCRRTEEHQRADHHFDVMHRRNTRNFIITHTVSAFIVMFYYYITNSQLLQSKTSRTKFNYL